MAARRSNRRNARRSTGRRRRRKDESLGGLLFIGALFAWYTLGAAWTIILVLAAAVLFVTFIVVRERRNHRRLSASGINDIDHMDGRQFEERLAAHFRQQGYRVDLTPYQGDFGADLIVERDGLRTAVQAKRYSGNVGVGAVQEIVSARGYYHCQQAMVVTNSSFTQAARQLAVANGVTLWDRNGLIHELAAIPGVAQPLQGQRLQW